MGWYWRTSGLLNRSQKDFAIVTNSDIETVAPISDNRLLKILGINCEFLKSRVLQFPKVANIHCSLSTPPRGRDFVPVFSEFPQLANAGIAALGCDPARRTYRNPRRRSVDGHIIGVAT